MTRVIPSGGTSGQVLAKTSGTSYAVAWANANSIPTGGATGTVLTKTSGTDYATDWALPYPALAGNANKVLTVNGGETAAAWATNTAATNIPSGGIIMYDGTLANFDGTGAGINTLLGWSLCNGVNGTRDMGGQIVFGYKSGDADFNLIGLTGGSKTFTVIEANLPPHAHAGTTDNEGAHTHTTTAVNSVGSGSSIATSTSGVSFTFYTNSIASSAGTAHNHPFTTNDGSGVSTPIKHLAPYITMAYIRKN